MDAKKHVITVGGGAAGMMAAIAASRHGSRVTILEKNPRVGKKILATGNGRCNYSNINTDVSHYYGGNPGFAQSALSSFSVQDTLNFFEELGIQPKVEERGKVFPASGQASSFLDVFLYEMKNAGINVICDAEIKEITKKNSRFYIELENGELFSGDSVIISTGGKAMPSSGSDGDGYNFAKAFGHTVTNTFPSLVQLMLEGDFFKRIDGVKIVGTAEIIVDNRSMAMDNGDILFANYGISGPPVLQISRTAAAYISEGRKVYAKINIMDSISYDELKELLYKRFSSAPEKSVEFSFVGLINKRLIPVILEQAGVRNIRGPVADLSVSEKGSIVRILNDWRFKIKGTKGWSSAQVTAGGVSTDEINPDTMESRITKGLFFAGEVMDIDGKSGGYNLQWAWSSGYIAGKNAAE